jgi:hypothetical protein
MFFLLGRRYPYLGAVVGAALIVIGVALHSMRFEVIGAIVLALGVVRTIAARRKAGLAGGRANRRSVQ